MSQSSAEEILCLICDGLESGEFSREDFEPGISKLERIISDHEQKKTQEPIEATEPHPTNGTCRSCKQPVVFATMLPSEKLVPINPALEEGGNVEVRANNTGKLFAKVTGPDAEQKKFISHFATCPQAKQWRKDGGK